jgi:hypothetical protein
MIQVAEMVIATLVVKLQARKGVQSEETFDGMAMVVV